MELLNPCAEVRRSCSKVFFAQKNISVKGIPAFIAQLEEEAEKNDKVVAKWSDFHLADISKYTLE